MSAVPNPTRVVVLGGGFAGLAFCQSLRDRRFQITLIDRQNHHLFQPLLYQVATAGLSMPEIAQPLRSILAHHDNVTTLMDEVRRIDLTGKRVECAGHCVEYDYLIIALGAQTGYFGRPEWGLHSVGLKSLEDAMDIRRRVLLAFERAEMSDDPAEVERLLTMVVVGGGPTGVEMAGSLAELARTVLKRDFRRIDPSKARIHLLEAGPKLLPTMPGGLPDYTAAQLGRLGVTVHLNCAVREIGPERLEAGALTLRPSVVVWAAGVEANAVTRTLGESIPLDRGGRIEVRQDLSLPGYPSVFAAGDIVSLVDKNGTKVPGVAPAASQMGRHIAHLIREDARFQSVARRFRTEVPRPAFAYWDKGNMATIGRSKAVAAAGPLRFTGFPAWLAWLFIHLLFLVGMRNRLSVFLQWVWAYATWERGARIITR
ncbi:MAG: NAD(P)/FAD-dependent oxidoreductase [Verrucomicrobiales bacterium]